MVGDCGIHPSLHSNCHYQITHSIFNPIILYAPLYKRRFWDYKKANSNNIQKAIEDKDWERMFNSV